MAPSSAILPAREEDVPAIMALLQQRIDWMDEKGLYQWNKTDYLTCYPPAHFQRLIREDLVFVAWAGGVLTGVMALLSRDPRWPNGDDGKAYYVHHLATSPSCPGLGKVMLAYAEDFARKRGILFNISILSDDLSFLSERQNITWERMYSWIVSTVSSPFARTIASPSSDSSANFFFTTKDADTLSR